MSKPRGRMSKAMAHACVKNSHQHISLQKELDLLNKQRARQVRNIQRDVREIEQGVLDTSPASSTTPRSAVRARASSSSPYRGPSSPHRRLPSPHKESASPRTEFSRLKSESASLPTTGTPRSPKLSVLLPYRRPGSAKTGSSASPRRSSVPGTVEVAVTDLKSRTLQPSSQQRLLLSAPDLQVVCANVPQIVVSDETAEELLKFPPKKKGSSQKTSSTGSPSSGSDSESETSLPSSLSLPHTQRLRSNSMPLIIPPPAFRLQSPRPSYTPPDTQPARDNNDYTLHVRRSQRDRSSSFSGILPASRRGSIPERWGSVTERTRPTSRRGSMDMDRLLRDLHYGVLNKELMRATQARSGSIPAPPFSSFLEQQWEEMKDCRYLRVPSTYSSEEEISNSD